MVKLNKFILLCIGIILILLIIYLGSLVSFIFRSVLSLFNNMVLVPLILSVFFYYLLRPLVNAMEARKINRFLAIVAIFLSIVILLTGFIIGVWPSLRLQLINLVQNAPRIINTLSDEVQDMLQNGFLAKFLPENANPLTPVAEFLNKGLILVTNYATNLFTFVSNFAITLFTFPIFLFYMLKEGDGFGPKIVSFIPKRFRKEGAEAIDEIDKVLGSFIQGRVVINLALGVLMYLGFLTIGLPYALSLTIIAVIMNFIPFVGAILSAIPIVIIGLFQSPSTAVWSLIVILIAQQIQDNVLSPYIFGKQLDIHPLTTIILLLVGGDLSGIIGIILVIPVYMIIKIVVVRVYCLFFKQKWENA